MFAEKIVQAELSTTIPLACSDRTQIIVDQLVENWQRTDLNAYELHDALVVLRDIQSLSQDEISRLTGKPKSDVSRLVSLSKIRLDLQETLRQDTSGQLSKRHLLAVARIPEEQQEAFVNEVRTAKLIALVSEKSANRLLRRNRGTHDKYMGSIVRRFVVPGATTVIRFRRTDVSNEDVLKVLDNVRRMVTGS